jgi:hypothetical protein
MDAIIVGRVLDVRLMDFPAATFTLEGDPPEAVWSLVNDCEGVLFQALMLDLEVQKTLLGEIGENVTVHLGQAHVAAFDPTPLRDPDGELTWLSKGSSEGNAIEAGMVVGLALHYVEGDELWSAMGENLFKLTSPRDLTGQVEFQKVRDDCWEPPPASIEGMTLDELVAFIATNSGKCSGPAAQRKQTVEEQWGSLSHYYWTAYCSPSGS